MAKYIRPGHPEYERITQVFREAGLPAQVINQSELSYDKAGRPRIIFRVDNTLRSFSLLPDGTIKANGKMPWEKALASLNSDISSESVKQDIQRLLATMHVDEEIHTFFKAHFTMQIVNNKIQMAYCDYHKSFSPGEQSKLRDVVQSLILGTEIYLKMRKEIDDLNAHIDQYPHILKAEPLAFNIDHQKIRMNVRFTLKNHEEVTVPYSQNDNSQKDIHKLFIYSAILDQLTKNMNDQIMKDLLAYLPIYRHQTKMPMELSHILKSEQYQFLTFMACQNDHLPALDIKKLKRKSMNPWIIQFELYGFLMSYDVNDRQCAFVDDLDELYAKTLPHICEINCYLSSLDVPQPVETKVRIKAENLQDVIFTVSFNLNKQPIKKLSLNCQQSLDEIKKKVSDIINTSVKKRIENQKAETMQLIDSLSMIDIAILKCLKANPKSSQSKIITDLKGYATKSEFPAEPTMFSGKFKITGSDEIEAAIDKLIHQKIIRSYYFRGAYTSYDVYSINSSHINQMIADFKPKGIKKADKDYKHFTDENWLWLLSHDTHVENYAELIYIIEHHDLFDLYPELIFHFFEAAPDIFYDFLQAYKVTLKNPRDKKCLTFLVRTTIKAS